jgi:hypothetical protein
MSDVESYCQTMLKDRHIASNLSADLLQNRCLHVLVKRVEEYYFNKFIRYSFIRLFVNIVYKIVRVARITLYKFLNTIISSAYMRSNFCTVIALCRIRLPQSVIEVCTTRCIHYTYVDCFVMKV